MTNKTFKQYYVTANIEFVCRLPYDSSTTKEEDTQTIEGMIEKGNIPNSVLVSDINIEKE